MKFLDLLRLSSSSLLKRKIRTILTVLGVTIGVASIVVMVSLGLGLNKSSMEQMESYGSLTAITVYEPGSYYSINAMESSSDSSEEEKRLDDALVETIRQLPHVEMVSPILNVSVLARCGIYESNVYVQGMSAEAFEAMKIPVGEGRYPDGKDGTLEFFYGGSIEEYAADDGRTSMGVALYFCDEAGYGAVKNDFAYADYLSLEGMSCAKFIPVEEFNSDKYAVEVTPFKKSVAHGEKMTVPEELFDEQRGSFALAFFAIYRLETQPYFFVGYRNCLTIDYELSDDGRVRLLQADASFL